MRTGSSLGVMGNRHRIDDEVRASTLGLAHVGIGHLLLRTVGSLEHPLCSFLDGLAFRRRPKGRFFWGVVLAALCKLSDELLRRVGVLGRFSAWLSRSMVNDGNVDFLPLSASWCNYFFILGLVLGS